MTERLTGLRFRPGVLAAVLLSVALAAFAAGVALIDRTVEGLIARRQEAVAASARDYFVAFAHEEGLAPLARALDRRLRVGSDEAFRYAVFAGDGVIMGGSRLLRSESLPGPGVTPMTIDQGDGPEPWEVLVQPIAGGGRLVIYEDLSERRDFRAALAAGSFAALLVAIASMLVASLWLNRLVYSRAQGIAATAERIAKGQVSARVPAELGGDVFDRLGCTINTMLDKNEDLMTGLRTVTDSLAHDLRTPLTRLKGALSRALDERVAEVERNEFIGQAWDEADRALATTSALLDIARAETGLSRDMFAPVDLSALAEDLAELFEPTLEDSGQTLTLDLPQKPVVILAHELLLRQALGNLLFNASRYAGDKARVQVRVETDHDHARLIVCDDGPGVPDADRGRVVERFVRLDAARTSPGAGLGLAIVAACAKLHRGTLRLEDNRPGLRVILELAR